MRDIKEDRMDYGTSFAESSFQWRFPLSFQSVFAVCLILQIIGLPETPRWLVQHDRHEEARAVIAAIEDKPLSDETISRTLLDIQTGLEEEQRGGPFRFAELFTNGETQNLRRLLLTISIELGQQFTGSNIINYYAPVLFQENMGMSRNLALVLSGAAQCTYLVGSAIPVLLMDRFGRRTLLMVCSAGLCLCFVMVSILLSLEREGAAYGATAFIFVFQLFYGVGWLPVPWFYPAEINTTRVRTKMQAIASGWNWMAVFAVVNAAFIPMVYCFYRETKGLELEDIPLLFAKGGVTGGVLTSKGGRTVALGQHARDVQGDRKVEVQEVEIAA
jgi:MFS family permease